MSVDPMRLPAHHSGRFGLTVSVHTPGNWDAVIRYRTSEATSIAYRVRDGSKSAPMHGPHRTTSAGVHHGEQVSRPVDAIAARSETITGYPGGSVGNALFDPSARVTVQRRKNVPPTAGAG